MIRRRRVEGEMTVEPPTRRRPDPKCPLRPGEPCTLCQYDVHGPEDCPLVYLIMNDPEDREAWAESRRH